MKIRVPLSRRGISTFPHSSHYHILLGLQTNESYCIMKIMKIRVPSSRRGIFTFITLAH